MSGGQIRSCYGRDVSAPLRFIVIMLRNLQENQNVDRGGVGGKVRKKTWKKRERQGDRKEGISVTRGSDQGLKIGSRNGEGLDSPSTVVVLLAPVI